MIDVNTVLVLGAGASVPYGFPTGQGLLQDALKHLSSKKSESFKSLQRICEVAPPAVQSSFFETEIERFVRACSAAGVRSLDAFLEHRPEFIPLGKAVIAQFLMPHEQPSKLYSTLDWYHFLGEHLNAPFDSLTKNRLAVITFNYDRSLEHFLHSAWLNRYGRPEHHITEAIRQIPIVHVHGSLGTLPWQEGENPCAYAGNLNPAAIWRASQSIQVVTDAHTAPFAVAHSLLRSAEQVVFLGLGYADTNMNRLDVLGQCGPDTRLLGTAMGITTREKARVDRRWFSGRSRLGNTAWGALTYLRECVSFERL